MPLNEEQLRKAADEEDKHPSISAGLRAPLSTEERLERIIERMQVERAELFRKIDYLCNELKEAGSILLLCSSVFGNIRCLGYPYNCIERDGIKEATARIDTYFSEVDDE